LSSKNSFMSPKNSWIMNKKEYGLFIICLFLFFLSGCAGKTDESGFEVEQKEEVTVDETVNLEAIEEDAVPEEEDIGESAAPEVIEKEDNKTVNEEKLRKAEQLFGELKAWQDNKDWQSFFSNKDSHKETIIGLLKDVDSPSSLRLKAKYLVFELKSFLSEKDNKAVLNDFLEEVKNIKEADGDLLLLLRYAISDLTSKSNMQARRKLSSLYIKLLKSSSSKDLLRREAEAFRLSKDIDNFAAVSSAYLDLIDNNAELKNQILLFIEKACCDGFKDACAPYFTEELFTRLDEEFGEKPDEGLEYLRAYNLEKASEFDKAVNRYGDFISRFPESDLLDEVLFRLGFIYMYKMNNFAKAKDYFLRLKDKGFNAERHLIILDRQLDKDKISYNEKVFLDALMGRAELPRNAVLQIESQPSKVFIGDKLAIRSLSFSPDTGCLVPGGLFLWSGDLGDVRITTNMPDFSTSFREGGLKIINLAEKIPEGVLGFDSALIDVYKIEVKIDGRMYKGGEVNFKVNVEPCLPERFLSYSWKVSGVEDVIFQSDEKETSYYFFKQGDYAVELNLFFLGRDIYKHSSTFTIQ